MWILLGIFSALFLGIYDVCKKWSLRDNDVLLVLFLSNCFALTLTLPVFWGSILFPELMRSVGLYAAIPRIAEHGYIVAKTILVSSSWIAAFFALKHLPISIVSPIRASAPLWTLLGAVFLFGEVLRPIHWGAIGIIFIAYYTFSVLGKKEGIRFIGNKWVFLVALATFFGAASALYDKYLLHTLHIPPVSLQVWFSFYLVLVNGAIVGGYRFIKWRANSGTPSFYWRYSIIWIGVLLIVADFLYFRALSHEESLIAILSIVRRSSVVVSFVLGGWIFKEKNKRKKMVPLFAILVGIGLLVLA